MRKYNPTNTWVYFLQKNGKFNRAMEHLAMKAMFSLQATLKLLGHPPPIPVILQLYESMLKPVMCYGSEVLGFNENKNLERVELRLSTSFTYLCLLLIWLCVES